MVVKALYNLSNFKSCALVTAAFFFFFPEPLIQITPQARKKSSLADWPPLSQCPQNPRSPPPWRSLPKRLPWTKPPHWLFRIQGNQLHRAYLPFPIVQDNQGRPTTTGTATQVTVKRWPMVWGLHGTLFYRDYVFFLPWSCLRYSSLVALASHIVGEKSLLSGD